MVYTLPHMRFNIKTGKYVRTLLPKNAQMQLSVKFDKEKYSKWCMEVNKKDTVDNEEKVKTDIVAVPDTGASVDCSGVDILAIFGLRRRHLIPTKAILRTANIKALTVLGIIPVEVETIVDKDKVKTM